MRQTRLITLVFAAGLGALSPAFAAADDEFGKVKEILHAKSEAWEEGDAEAWGKDYRENSALINIFGMRFPDRKTNIERHAVILDGLFRDTSLDVEIERIERLGEGVVLAETLLTVTGYDTLPQGVPETSSGMLQTRMTFVVQEDESAGWQIVFAQNTAIQSP